MILILKIRKYSILPERFFKSNCLNHHVIVKFEEIDTKIRLRHQIANSRLPNPDQKLKPKC